MGSSTKDDIGSTPMCNHPEAGKLCDRRGGVLLIGYLVGHGDFDQTPGVWIVCDSFRAASKHLIVAVEYDIAGLSSEQVVEVLCKARHRAVASFVDVVGAVERPAKVCGKMVSEFVSRYDGLIDSLMYTAH